MKVKDAGKVATQTQFEDSGAKGVLTSKSHRIKTVEQLLKHCEVDQTQWKADRVVVNKWEVGSKVDGTILTEQLFQIKVWLVRNEEQAVAVKAADVFKDLVRNYKPRSITKPVKSKSKKEYMLELGCAGDLHLGKLAHGPETRGGDYDAKIAVDLYRQAVDTIISRSPISQLEKILLVFGGDQYHTDGMLNQTTAGTPQDFDGRFHKVYKMGCDMAIEAIDKALSIAPVEVVVIQGNHDNITSWHLGAYLQAWYRDSTHVTIDNRPTARHYVHWHSNLICLTHGDSKNAMKNLSKIIANECRDIWSTVSTVESHSGHLHRESSMDDYGCVHRTLAALTGTDKWHSDSGYIGSRQAAQGFLWHKDRGMEGTLCFNVK